MASNIRQFFLHLSLFVHQSILCIFFVFFFYLEMKQWLNCIQINHLAMTVVSIMSSAN